jgi:transcriptional regulator with XRE-family HTH domain
MDDDDGASAIGSEIRRRRNQLGLSQTAAALEADLARRTWMAIEKGRRRANPETLAKIERALQMPAGSLGAFSVVQPTDEMAAIKRNLVEMIDLLGTREELEQARLALAHTRFEAAKAALEKYEQEARAAHDARPEADP